MSSTTAATGWTQEFRELVSKTVGSDLDPASLRLLEHVAVSKGLDPLSQEIYAVRRGKGAPTLITSIHGMSKLVASELDGLDCVWFDSDGNQHDVWLNKDAPAGCKVTVWRKGSAHPFTAAVRTSDFAAGNLWTKMPSVMIKKVATAHALRSAFGDLLSGLYSSEEMDQSGLTNNNSAPSRSKGPSSRPAPRSDVTAVPKTEVTPAAQQGETKSQGFNNAPLVPDPDFEPAPQPVAASTNGNSDLTDEDLDGLWS